MYKCTLCKGSGIAEYIDISDSEIPYGNHNLGDLVDKYGKEDVCSDCNGLGETDMDNSSFQSKMITSGLAN